MFNQISCDRRSFLAGALAASFMGGCRSLGGRNVPPRRIGANANGKANFCDQAYCKTMFISV